MIYADYNATYPHTKKSLEEIFLALYSDPDLAIPEREIVANPSSIHMSGRLGRKILETTRVALSKHLASEASEIIFTSGATEAHNLLIQGFIKQKSKAKKKPRVLLSWMEHAACLQPLQALERDGLVELGYLKLDRYGQIDPLDLEDKLTQTWDLLCLIHIHNETGLILNLQAIAERTKHLRPQCHIHVDGVQALGRISTECYGSPLIDSAVFSAHKIGGFMGTGALLIKDQSKKNLPSLIQGGQQEQNKRAGTENVLGIFSFYHALKRTKQPEYLSHLLLLRTCFLDQVKDHIPLVWHGEDQNHHPSTIHFHIEGRSQDQIMWAFEQNHVMASRGSACHSGTPNPSPALLAMGYSTWIAKNSVRLSFGHHSSLEDVKNIARLLLELA